MVNLKSEQSYIVVHSKLQLLLPPGAPLGIRRISREEFDNESISIEIPQRPYGTPVADPQQQNDSGLFLPSHAHSEQQLSLEH
jgi:hypothetical protein